MLLWWPHHSQIFSLKENFKWGFKLRAGAWKVSEFVRVWTSDSKSAYVPQRLQQYILFYEPACMYSACDLSFFEGTVMTERKQAALTDVLMHSCAQREHCTEAVFCVCWLELRQTHSDTSKLSSCSPSASLRLGTPPRLCWKRMGDRLGRLWRHSPVNQHSALAGSPSQIDNKNTFGKKKHSLKGWAELKKKTHTPNSSLFIRDWNQARIHAGWIALHRSTVIRHCECCSLMMCFYRWQALQNISAYHT